MSWVSWSENIVSFRNEDQCHSMKIRKGIASGKGVWSRLYIYLQFDSYMSGCIEIRFCLHLLSRARDSDSFIRENNSRNSLILSWKVYGIGNCFHLALSWLYMVRLKRSCAGENGDRRRRWRRTRRSRFCRIERTWSVLSRMSPSNK